MRYLKVLIFVVIFFVLTMFFVQNHDVLQQIVTLKLDFLINPAWSSIPMPFYFMVLAAFVIGCVLTTLILIYDRLRLSNNLRKANKRIRILEMEVNSLRTLPLTENAEGETAEEKPAETAEK